ncbi:sensor histidine kinase [Kribbella sp. NPDC051587]|uniref:sensor histidine kinase n=1 Tax=Kribbella sp. NPDC051587 TaxID=3364119 RepID=UPI00379D890F
MNEPVPPVVQRAMWWVAGLHFALLALAPSIVLTQGGGPRSAAERFLAVVASLLMAALHLRHIWAAMRGGRPRGWRWTLVVQMIIAFVPALWLGADVGSSQIVVAAGAMILARDRRFPALGVGLLATTIVLHAYLVHDSPHLNVALEVAYYATVSVIFACVLYGTVRLVQVVDELYRTRIELAELAVDRERIAVSRDLHDLLGQSLSAISLKGDLAVRLLRRDPARAYDEIASLTELARSARRDIRAITFGAHQVSLPDEIAAAERLLAAAGVRTLIDLGPAGPELPDELRQMLARTVREGTTNLLRHSEATICEVTVRRDAQSVSLEMTNDGVRQLSASGGTGLTGLSDRARDLGGSAVARPVDGDRFRLLVTLPLR